MIVCEMIGFSFVEFLTHGVLILYLLEWGWGCWLGRGFSFLLEGRGNGNGEVGWVVSRDLELGGGRWVWVKRFYI